MEQQLPPSGTKVKQCNCKHEFQDKTYGKQIRVHNIGGVKGSLKYSCTVCNNKS